MQYWIVINNEQRGPVEKEHLRLFPEFGPDTPIWRQGLADWTTASQLPEADEIFGRTHEQPRPEYGSTATISDPYAGVYNKAVGAPGTPSRPDTRPQGYPEMPPTYLVWAILSTICCCLVTGIVAIIYASKVAPLYNRGDFAGARDASSKAGLWVIITFVSGLIWAPFYTLYSLLTAL